jgi:hypothetical protein
MGMAKSGYKGISRIDQPKKNTHGWYVRVRFNGAQRVKFFSDNAHGGRDEALQEAVRFRDRAEQEMGKPRTDRLVIAHNPRNRSGIMGIRRKTKVIQTEDGERVVSNVYEITWNPEPGRLCRTFVSIDKLGEKEALREACRIRREKEREMFGSVVKASWASSLAKLLDA